jgi:hypothetical protein
MSLLVTVPFKSTAAADSMKSWRQLIRQFLEPDTILNISVIHPTKARIFFDSRSLEKVQEFLKTIRAQETTHEDRDRDVTRLAATYLRGYFKLLRKAVIADLGRDLQLAVLTKAEELIGSKEFFRDNQVFQLLWRNWVAQDKKELQNRTLVVQDKGEVAREEPQA